MRAPAYKLPYLITVIALAVPWASNFPGMGAFNWLPEMLTLLGLAYFTGSSGLNTGFKPAQIFLILFFVFHMVSQGVSGGGIGGSPVVSLVLVTSIFFVFLKMTRVESLEVELIRQVSTLYGIHVAFVLFEILLLNTGTSAILSMLSNGTYKPKIADFYTPMPQGIYKDNQAASQACIFAIGWFMLLFFARARLDIRFRRAYWFCILGAVVAFAAYPTTTMLAIGLVLYVLAIYLLPFLKNNFVRIGSAVAGAISVELILVELTRKFNPEIFAHSEEYYRGFFGPIETFLNLPAYSRIMGVGNIESLAEAGVADADFGLLIYILRIGVLPAIIAAGALVLITCRMLQVSYKRSFNQDPANFRWLWLGCANALLAIGNLLSIGHYTVSLQAGGRTLFSFHIALVLLCLHKLSQVRLARNGQPVRA